MYPDEAAAEESQSLWQTCQFQVSAIERIFDMWIPRFQIVIYKLKKYSKGKV